MSFAVSNKMSLTRGGAASKRMVAANANTTKGKTTSSKGGAAAINNIDFLKSLPGVSQPFPDVFDPANLSATASVKDIRRWRESELVHGRVAMLAALGFVVQENIQDNRAFFPFAGKITGPAIYHFQQIKQGFWEPLLILIGIAEAYRVTVGWAPPVNGAEFNALREEYDMGDLGFDPLGLKPKDPEALYDLQTKELNNGRLAMIAVAGFVGQELLFQHEVLTWGGFQQSLDEAPVDPKDIKGIPPLPVQFPDRGLPNAGDVKNAFQSSKNSLGLPTMNLPNFLGTPGSPPNVNSLPNIAEGAKDGVFQPPPLNLSNVKPPPIGLNFSGSPIGDTVSKAADSAKNSGAPSIPNPLSGLNFPSGGEIANKAQQAKNSLPGGVPSGGEVANKAQELKNSLPNPFSGFGSGNASNNLPSGQDVANKANEVKNSLPNPFGGLGGKVSNNLPSGQDVANKANEVKNSLPNPFSGFGGNASNNLPSGQDLANKANDAKNSLPSFGNLKTQLTSALPSGGEIANKAQQAKNSLPGGLPSGGEIANKAQELKNALPNLSNPLGALPNFSLPSGGEVANKAQELKNSLPGGLPSGGQVANKAQELKNALPSLPNPFKTGLSGNVDAVKNALPSTQDVKNALPNPSDIFNRIPDIPKPSVSVNDVRTPGKSF